MSRRRVVVTGLGIVSPVGSAVEHAWKNVVDGLSGIGPIKSMDVSLFTTRFGGVVKGFDVRDYVPPKEARKIDPFMHYGIGACQQALDDSGLEITDANRHRIAVAVGSGIGGIGTIEANAAKFHEAGHPRKISPFFVPGSIINMVSGHVSILHGITGPNISLVTACTTATHSIGFAARMIAYGDAEAYKAQRLEFRESLRREGAEDGDSDAQKNAAS